MFKKYTMQWRRPGQEDSPCEVDFFVCSKPTRGGFAHLAAAIGPLPRLDEDDWQKYSENNDKLMPKRRLKVNYLNRTWEYWSGQECLRKLWERLAELKFVDMGRISAENPFQGKDEPEHEDLWDPQDIFR